MLFSVISLFAAAVLLTSGTDAQQATCTSYKVRRNWDNMGPANQAKYLNAVNALKNLATVSGNTFMQSSTWPKQMVTIAGKTVEVAYNYDGFVNLHYSSVPDAHGLAQFLPWHRKFLAVYEKHLQDVSGDPSITVPYFNWAQYAAAPQSAPIFKKTDISFGHRGDSTKNFCMTTGITKNWKKVFPTANPNVAGECIKRAWDNSQATTEQILPFVDLPTMARNVDPGTFGTYNLFRRNLEGAAHALPHIYIGGFPSNVTGNVGGNGGDLYTMFSPNDPIFFSHHANIDRYWYLWQTNPTNKNAYTYNGNTVACDGTNQAACAVNNGALTNTLAYHIGDRTTAVYNTKASYFENVRVSNVIDSQKGNICVRYDPPEGPKDADIPASRVMGEAILWRDCASQTPSLPEDVIAMMRLTLADVRASETASSMWVNYHNVMENMRSDVDDDAPLCPVEI